MRTIDGESQHTRNEGLALVVILIYSRQQNMNAGSHALPHLFIFGKGGVFITMFPVHVLVCIEHGPRARSSYNLINTAISTACLFFHQERCLPQELTLDVNTSSCDTTPGMQFTTDRERTRRSGGFLIGYSVPGCTVPEDISRSHFINLRSFFVSVR